MTNRPDSPLSRLLGHLTSVEKTVSDAGFAPDYESSAYGDQLLWRRGSSLMTLTDAYSLAQSETE